MPNEILDAIASRYSCRSFTAEPVARADLEALALAAAQAPSSRGGAPWYVAIITNRELIDDINRCALSMLSRHERAAYERVEARATNLFFDAPAMIIVATKNTHDYTSADLDAGLLVENVALAAVGLGLGTCICGYATQAFRDRKSDDGQRLAKALDFPWGYEMTVSILVGHPAGPGTPHTPDLSKVRYFE